MDQGRRYDFVLDCFYWSKWQNFIELVISYLAAMAIHFQHVPSNKV